MKNHLPASVLLLLCVLLSDSPTQVAAQQNQQKFDRIELQVDGLNCFVDKPRWTAPGRPWVWRA